MIRLQQTDKEKSTENESERSRRNKNLVLAVVTVLWLMLVGAGLVLLMIYGNRPGDRGFVPTTWPQHSDLPRTEARSTLLVFAHPKCPCTRATIDELAWIMTRCGDSVDCRVLFLQPAGHDFEWSHTDSWRTASTIPGVQVMADVKCRAAGVFGARTSGHVMLYDGRGRLRFEGGITPSRGHRGGNRGRERVVSLLSSDIAASALSAGRRGSEFDARADSTCVFGCPLHASSPSASAGVMSHEG